MRIPINWLKEFVDLPKERKVLTDKLTMVGHMLDKKDVVNGNIVLDLELRSNRADCYSIEGIAREVGAIFSKPVYYPKISTKLTKVEKLKDVSLTIKTQLVKRVMMAAINDVKIAPSPDWLKNRLIEYGMPSINNIVDLTNYVMIETGEPMHAFDMDKVGESLEIRLANKGEQMLTFLDQTLTLTNEDLVWSNAEAILSVAGAIGGKERSISDNTKNVLLEAASYDRANIRKSIHRHNLLTDAGIRHEKDLDPNIVENAIYRFCDLISKNKWGKVIPYALDYYPKPVKPWKISLSWDYLYSLGGVKIDPKTVVKILKSLNFKILKSSSKAIEVEIPTYRTDVVLPEDLIEEIIRIYGYDNIPTQTLSLEIPQDITPGFIKQESKLREIMVSLGFNEVISSSFVREDSLNYNSPLSEEINIPVKVENRPSQDVEVLRMSILPNLLEVKERIFNERGSESYLFEIGKVYFKVRNKYSEKRKLGILFAQDKNLEFVYFKGFIEALFAKLGLENIQFEKEELGNNKLNDTYKISMDKKTIGYGGETKGAFYSELDLDSLLGKSQEPNAILWPKYPPQIEDITLVIPAKTKVGDLLGTLLHSNELVSNVDLRDTYKDSYTFRIWYQAKNRTLNDKEVENARNKILSAVKAKFGAVLKN